MDNQRDLFIGTAYALLAYVTWGVLPLYWKLMESLPAVEILAHRMVWSFLFVLTILLLTFRQEVLKQEVGQLVTNRKQFFALLVAALAITINWGVYIWAVIHNQVIQLSLGYYINPLLVVLLGVFLLKEQLNYWQKCASVLAGIGVLVLTLYSGSIPWIALTLAICFAIYGLAKKIAGVRALLGLAFETALSFPYALVYLTYLHLSGTGSFATYGWNTSLLLIGAGAVTALPLYWFAKGAQKISLSMLGFYEYIAPSINLLIGVFLFQEPFTKVHLISFILIWSALALFSLSNTRWFAHLEARLRRKRSVSDRSIGA